MNRYIKLVQMEVHRFRYILFSLMGIVAVSEIGGLIWKVSNELVRIEQHTRTERSIYFQSEKLSFTWAIFSTHIWFDLPILLGIQVLSLYVFLIWYRDWLGRYTFIYRQLMLPSARRHLYWSKLTAILLFVFSLVAFQLLLLPIEQGLFNLLVSADMRVPSYFTDVIYADKIFTYLMPLTFEQFATLYGLGILGVLTIFTAILLERSYGRWGILYAGSYVFLCWAAIVLPLPLLGLEDSNAYFYPREIIGTSLAFCAVVCFVSLGLALRLLNKKITV